MLLVSVDQKTGQRDEGSHGPKRKHPIRLESLQFIIIEKQKQIIITIMIIII